MRQIIGLTPTYNAGGLARELEGAGHDWEGLFAQMLREIDQRWPVGNPHREHMQKFREHLASGAFHAYFLSEEGSRRTRDDLGAAAYHLAAGDWDNKAYVRSDRDMFRFCEANTRWPIPRESVFRFTLLVFCEYQHSGLNPTGRKDEPAAQSELVPIRGAIVGLADLYPRLLVTRTLVQIVQRVRESELPLFGLSGVFCWHFWHPSVRMVVSLWDSG